jgi:hypothetical protein
LRRVATLSLAGFALVLADLLAEWQWGVDLAVTRGEVVVPALWRLALHAGAVLLAWSAIRYARERGDTLSRIGRVHGWLLAAAAFGTVAVLVAWRVLGAFPPQIWW